MEFITDFVNNCIQQIKKILDYIIGIIFILVNDDKYSTTVIGIIVISLLINNIFIYKIRKMKNKMLEMEEEINRLKAK